MKNKESNFVSAVVYLHYKEVSVRQFLSEIYTILADSFNKFELICVNDDADEDTIQKIRTFKEEHSEAIIRIVTMGFRHGVEAAMNAGVDLSIGDYVFEFDSTYIDYQTPLIMEVYKKALSGYDIVSAVPPKSGSKISSRIFYYVYNRCSENENDLETERFRVISRRAINRVSAYSRMIPYRKAVYNLSGLRIAKIKYMPTKSISALKHADFKKNDTALDTLVIFTNMAYRVSLFISAMMAMFMVTAGFYTVFSYLSRKKPVEGWAPIMGLIAAGFLAVFVILTVIIKYLDVILKVVFKKQKYLVSSIEKL